MPTRLSTSSSEDLRKLSYKHYLKGYLAILAAFVTVEVLLQSGAYDRFLEPRSFAGQAMARRRRIDGLARSGRLPTIVALGSSRTQEAFDEVVLNDHAALGTSRFINLGLIGAGLPTETAMARYIADLDRRRPKVFVLEVDPRDVLFGPGQDHETALIAPFTPLWSNAAELIRVFTPRLSMNSLSLALRLFAYRGDLRDVLLKPRSHLQAAAAGTRVVDWQRGNRKDGDVCELWAVSAAECSARSKELFSRTREPRWQATAAICAGYLNRPLAEQVPRVMPVSMLAWRSLLEFLKGRGSRAVLLLVPQATVDLRQLPEGSLEAVRSLLIFFREAGLADYLDLSELLRKGRECEWFYDPFHVNRIGAELASQRLRDELSRMFPES
jgi:hypothetical protein